MYEEIASCIKATDKEFSIWLGALLKALLSKEIITQDEWNTYKEWAKVEFHEEYKY